MQPENECCWMRFVCVCVLDEDDFSAKRHTRTYVLTTNTPEAMGKKKQKLRQGQMLARSAVQNTQKSQSGARAQTFCVCVCVSHVTTTTTKRRRHRRQHPNQPDGGPMNPQQLIEFRFIHHFRNPLLRRHRAKSARADSVRAKTDQPNVCHHQIGLF